MNLLGSKKIETKRLILRKTEEEDLKKLWEILKKEEINKYYLTTKINFVWEKEKKWQYKKLEKASNSDVFCWTIIIKDTNTVIGQISVQEGPVPDVLEIRDIGWFIDIPYQRQGYAYEAANAVLDYMFTDVEIEEIETSAACVNPGSWKLMEKLDFKRLDTTHFVKYTFVDEPIKVYEYKLVKKDFLNKER